MQLLLRAHTTSAPSCSDTDLRHWYTERKETNRVNFRIEQRNLNAAFFPLPFSTSLTTLHFDFPSTSSRLSGTRQNQPSSLPELSRSDTHLDETDISGLLPERLTAHVEPVLADYACVLALASHDASAVSMITDEDEVTY